MQTLDDADILKLWNGLTEEDRESAMLAAALAHGADDFFDLTPAQRREARKEAVS